jgi:hypothetical protein
MWKIKAKLVQDINTHFHVKILLSGGLSDTIPQNLLISERVNLASTPTWQARQPGTGCSSAER